MTPAAAVPIIASYGRTRRAPSDRGRPLGDVGRGLGRGRRCGDRGLSREAPCVSRLPRGCRRLELTWVLLLFAEPELALEDALRHRADGRRLRLAVLEQDHHRDRGDAVALRQPLLLVDVHLDDAHRVVVRDPVEHRRDGVTGTTPFGPEVDNDLAFPGEDFLLERGLGCFGWHRVLSAYFLFERAAGRVSSLPRLDPCSTLFPRCPIPTPSSSRCSSAGSERVPSSNSGR